MPGEEAALIQGTVIVKKALVFRMLCPHCSSRGLWHKGCIVFMEFIHEGKRKRMEPDL